MKKPVLLFALCLVAWLAKAQKPLTNSADHARFTYVYRLSDASVRLFYANNKYKLDERIQGAPLDSFVTGHYRPWHLPPGNYMEVSVVNNRVNYKLIENRSATLKLLDNAGDLKFVLLDTSNREISNAVVFAGKHQVPFDAAMNLYHSPWRKKDTLLCVAYQGVNNFYKVKARISRYYRYNAKHELQYYNMPYKQPGWLSRLWTTWFGKKMPNLYDPASPNPGYVVFNKPKYRPGDTVKLKAFIVQEASFKTVSEGRLAVRLEDSYNSKGKILGYVNAYRPGAFEFSFKLADSLKLRLDQNYNVDLETPDNPYDMNTERSKYLAYRKVFMQGNIHYEDYELTTAKFEVRADKTEHVPGDPAALYMRATDDNGLDLPDGRVTVTLTTNSASQYNNKHIFVPDTLWQHQMNLDPVGETKLMLPDSIFPDATISYRAQVVLLTSNNERREVTKYLTYQNKRFQLKHDLDGDTLRLDYLKLGKSTSAKAVLYKLSDANDTLSRSSINLPAAFVIDPAVTKYVLTTDSLKDDFDANEFEAGLQLHTSHTSDSLKIRLDNPRHLNFWYTIFQGDKAIAKVSGTQLDFKMATKNPAASVVVNYIWAGKVQTEQAAADYRESTLTIDMNAPDAVYPGQQTDIKLHVKDANGKPVPNVDLTAFAITSKFENYNLPSIPYLGKTYPGRQQAIPLLINKLKNTGNFELNWQRWSKQMGLDTIEYYKFTHPESLYTINEPTPDSTTQIAPFVVKDGDIIPVHIVYLDGLPVYFSKTNDKQRYSFMVSPGYHTLSLRTETESIRVDTINVKKYRKLILSVNLDTLHNKGVTFKTMSDTLMTYEAELINNYMTSIIPNFGNHLATVTQGGRIFLLGANNNSYSYTYNRNISRNNNGLLVGPLANNFADFDVKGGISQGFITEPGYSFQFDPGLIKQKSIPGKYPFSINLAKLPADTSYKQYALTQKAVDTTWQNYLDMRSHNLTLFSRSYSLITPHGDLTIGVSKQKDGNIPFIKSVIVFKYDDPNFAQIYPGSSTGLGFFAPGEYRIFYLLKGNKCFVQEHVSVKPYGKNYYSTGDITIHAPDMVSRKINAIIDRHEQYGYNDFDVQQIKEAFNGKYPDMTLWGGEMTGYVYDTTRATVPGAVIKVRGMQQGTTTDANGFFRIRVPKTGFLDVTSLGYRDVGLLIHPGLSVEIILQTASTALKEVVVNGAPVIKYFADTIEYKASDYKVRPNATLDELLKKMEGFEVGSDGSITQQGQAITRVRLNGKDYVGGDVAMAIQNLPADIIERAQVVDDYGDQAAHTGLKDGDAEKILNLLHKGTPKGKMLIINTDKDFVLGLNDPALLAMQSIRKNFSDYAYWQPKLTTDADGNASFKTTFPDDITQWHTFVIGMNGNKQTGIADGQIRAYKPLSATLAAPQFAVRGDVLNPIGKVLNYTKDTVHLQRTFKFNGGVVSDNIITVKNAQIDTFKVTAAGKDSLSFEYIVKKGNGYFDGEKRSIPIFEQGSLETKGMFASLDKDTTITIQLDPKLKEGTFHAEASVLPALLDETEHLRNYEYLCNEQLASKLKGLLSEKKIMKYLDQPFKYDKDINEIIKRLLDSRRVQGTWGWWKDSDEELWISLHAAEALLEAEAQGFETQLDKQKMIDYLLYQATSYKGEDKLNVLLLLRKLGARADYESLINAYIKELGPKTFTTRYDSIRLMLVQQQAGLPYLRDSLSKWMKRTMMGNVYWGEENYNFFNNSIQVSLMAYQLLKAEGKQPELLSKLRNYFLEQRKDGYWRNTYESADILETILPDLLINGKKPEPSVIVLSGAKNETVKEFPYTTSLSGSTALTVKKTGTMPVYITAYQKFWNPEPEKVSKDFTVDTKFEKNSQAVTKAKGGEPITLQVEVNARADADFVMVEIPIPAGCSYLSKNQGYNNNEVHREYFKNKVSIFCRKLTAGKHTFTISLTPRYGGTYHVNPAKAEMMYFPIFYGREGMKVFSIE